MTFTPTTLTPISQAGILSAIGRKAPEQIREWSAADTDRAWALDVADKLAVSGYVTLADVTEDELVDITRTV
ncbi:hypothetical protein [Frigoribacterium sp. MCBA15_019]|uniref:hypothetical protein n=1 Tax=Frigoribacterium sp. MCBA15_019 TaxID=1898745 RepID=UPI0008DE8226|nr:hypothetical protein [Frigoribacterium sp. MCBA15_019]OII27291.1 hypothetical protein BIV04_01640 [Frigoribacterium sp. MCBA15_019]